MCKKDQLIFLCPDCGTGLKIVKNKARAGFGVQGGYRLTCSSCAFRSGILGVHNELQAFEYDESRIVAIENKELNVSLHRLACLRGQETTPPVDMLNQLSNELASGKATGDALSELRNLCGATVRVLINPHVCALQSAVEYLNTLEKRYDEFSRRDMSTMVLNYCEQNNTLVCVRCYQYSPTECHVVVHHSIEHAIEEALQRVKANNTEERQT